MAGRTTTAYLGAVGPRAAADPGARRGGPMSVRLPGATVADEAMVSIVRGAVSQVEGARLDRPSRIARVLPGRRGAVEWQVDGEGIRFDVDVAATYGLELPDLARFGCGGAWPPRWRESR